MTGYRIACLTKNRTNPAYVGAQVGAARLAEGLGCELRGYVPDRPDNVEDQLGNIRDAMAWRPDAMLISPVDATALNEALAGVKDAGVTLVYFVTSTEGLEADAFMTSDNYALAKEIAEYLVRHLGGTGQVAILDGPDLQTLVAGLNRIGVKPDGVIAILQAIKSAGALQAELVVQ